MIIVRLLSPVTFNSDGYATSDTRAFGTPEQQTMDSLNRQTSYTYDSKANVTSVTQLAGTSNAATTSFTYEPTFSQLTAVTDSLGHTNSFGYDDHGNLVSAVDPLGNTTTLAFEDPVLRWRGANRLTGYE